jgi:hypothetical protein
MTKFKPDILFILSVDTEEEWDWSGEFPQDHFSVNNLGRIPQFQDFCHAHGIRPTYFVDYAAASSEKYADFLRDTASQGGCELGAHLHPWSNPPYFGYTSEKESHVVNLPIEQVEQKLDELIRLFHEKFAMRPVSFRTGRWGINSDVIELLIRKGFNIDSSMYPFYRNEFFNCDHVYPKPFWPRLNDPHQSGIQRDLLEIPVTVGFNRKNFALMDKLHNALEKPGLLPLRMIGLLWKARLMRKLYLSPEVLSGEEMTPLVDTIIANNFPVMHMYFHSSSLIEGTTGFMKKENAIGQICDNIVALLDYAKSKANIQFCTISEAACLLKNRAQGIT